MSPRDLVTAILAVLKMSDHKQTRSSKGRNKGPSVPPSPNEQQRGGRNEGRGTRWPTHTQHTAIHRWTRTTFLQEQTTIKNTFHLFEWIRPRSVTNPWGAVSQEVRIRLIWVLEPQALLNLLLYHWPQANRAGKPGPRVWSGRRKRPGLSAPFSWLSL